VRRAIRENGRTSRKEARVNVPLLDLKAQYLTIKDEVVRAMMEVVEEQNFILGPKVAELERRVAEYSGASRGVGVSSGTDALIISLMAAGVSRGDYVVTTPYTFFATAGAVARLGAVPVFADIDPKTYNIDPAKFEEAAAKLPGKKLKAAIPVPVATSSTRSPGCKSAKPRVRSEQGRSTGTQKRS